MDPSHLHLRRAQAQDDMPVDSYTRCCSDSALVKRSQIRTQPRCEIFLARCLIFGILGYLHFDDCAVPPLGNSPAPKQERYEKVFLARGVSGVSSLVPAAAKELIDRPAVGYSRAPPGRQIPVLVFLFLKDIRSIEGPYEEVLQNNLLDSLSGTHIPQDQIYIYRCSC